jgi:hypothetical protein
VYDGGDEREPGLGQKSDGSASIALARSLARVGIKEVEEDGNRDRTFIVAVAWQSRTEFIRKSDRIRISFGDSTR